MLKSLSACRLNETAMILVMTKSLSRLLCFLDRGARVGYVIASPAYPIYFRLEGTNLQLLLVVATQ